MAQEPLNPQHDQFVEEQAEQLQLLKEAVEQVLPQGRYFAIEHTTGTYWQYHQRGDVADLHTGPLRLDRVMGTIADKESVRLTFRFFIDPSSYQSMSDGLAELDRAVAVLRNYGTKEETTSNDDRSALAWSVDVSYAGIFALVKQVCRSMSQFRGQILR